MNANDRQFFAVVREKLATMCDNTYPRVCALVTTEEGRAYVEHALYEMAGAPDAEGATIDSLLAQLEEMQNELTD